MTGKSGRCAALPSRCAIHGGAAEPL